MSDSSTEWRRATHSPCYLKLAGCTDFHEPLQSYELSLWVTEEKVHLQTALRVFRDERLSAEQLHGGLPSFSPCSAFSKLCCSWLPALHLLCAQLSSETKNNSYTLSHGVVRAHYGSFAFPLHSPTSCCSCDWQLVCHKTSHTQIAPLNTV